MKNIFKIGISIGDVNGIGLEILGKYFESNHYKRIASHSKIFIFGNKKIIIEYFSKLHYGLKYINIFESLLQSKQIELVEIDYEFPIQFGKVTEFAGKLALESLKNALKFYQSKLIDSLVTLPICKESIQFVTPNFIGHTEFISQFYPGTVPLMTFVYKNLILCLLTTHQPLKNVPYIITKDTIWTKVNIFDASLRSDFGIVSPKIAILGLNPHSGENGSFGNEEITNFFPAIEKLKKNGIKIDGPFPSDSFFAFGLYKSYDGIVACYHDQGLIPFKLISKGKGVNYTANLPIVRTSPDHGTGFDIAGKNIADFTSLKNSIDLAIKITLNRKKGINKLI